MTDRLFRMLLVGSLGFGFVGAFLDTLFPALLHPAFQSAQQAHDSSLSTLRTLAFALVGLVSVGALLSATYGLYCFRPWAPRLALFSTLAALFIWPLSGAYALSGWAYALSDIGTYLWGAAVLVANVPPYNSRFRRIDG